MRNISSAAAYKSETSEIIIRFLLKKKRHSPLCFCMTPDPILITSHSKDITVAKSRKCIWAAGERPLHRAAVCICGGLRWASGPRVSSTAKGPERGNFKRQKGKRAKGQRRRRRPVEDGGRGRGNLTGPGAAMETPNVKPRMYKQLKCSGSKKLRRDCKTYSNQDSETLTGFESCVTLTHFSIDVQQQSGVISTQANKQRVRCLTLVHE
ncbi:hypothetical protein F2P81_012141 [Scophthalmus maximus]|uniref:Uncharacterized protein n=1 Tax=Scophthalmus maximus TaxID=52904 RepID=A0A6A4SJR9_SCOMX|nr:hypothetical protein F2P81_012141 [Scophthalmus maximus]